MSPDATKLLDYLREEFPDISARDVHDALKQLESERTIEQNKIVGDDFIRRVEAVLPDACVYRESKGYICMRWAPDDKPYGLELHRSFHRVDVLALSILLNDSATRHDIEYYDVNRTARIDVNFTREALSEGIKKIVRDLKAHIDQVEEVVLAMVMDHV